MQQQTIIDEECGPEEKSMNNLPTLKQLWENREISTRACNCLARAGILTLEGVTSKTYEELARLRHLGSITLSEIMSILKKYGLQLKEPEKVEIKQGLADMSLDDMKLSVQTYNCLKNAGINKLQDIIDLNGKDFIGVKNLKMESAQEVIEKLDELGVPYELREHLNDAFTDAKDTFDTLKSSIPLYLEIRLASGKLRNGDYAGFLVHFEKAVELGFRKDYSIIGELYLAGVEGVTQDYAKGLKWLQKFYDDFKAGNLELDGKNVMTDVCYQLGAVRFIELQKEHYPTTLRDRNIKDTLNIWRDAVNYAPEESDDSGYSADGLYNIGCCFYYGEINCKILDDVHDDHDDLELYFKFQSDYEYAYKALAKAEKLGNVAATTLLAKMNGEDQLSKFLTTAEIAKLWKITPRRVQILCKEGRVEGAVFKGVWLIPDTAKKPENPRKKGSDSNGQ